MSSSKVKTPSCPRGYKLHSDHRTSNSCKCVKKKDGDNDKYEKTATRMRSPRSSSSSRYLKLKERYTIKNKGRDGRCPSGTRYNKESGLCEKRRKKRSLMSAIFKERSPDIKTRRKQYSPKRIKKRTKCPDGYFLNKKYNVCERRSKTNYYAKFARLANKSKTAKAKTAKAKTVKAKTVKAKTAKAKTVLPTKTASYYDRFFGKRSNSSGKNRTVKKTVKLAKTINPKRGEKTLKQNKTMKKMQTVKTISPKGIKGFTIRSPSSVRKGKTRGKTVKFNRSIKTIRSPRLRKPINLERSRSPQKILKNRQGTPLEVERVGQTMRQMIKDNPEKAATIRTLGRELGIRTRAKPTKRVETRV